MALRRAVSQLLPRLASISQGQAAMGLGAPQLLQHLPLQQQQQQQQPQGPARLDNLLPFAARGYGAVAPSSSAVQLVEPETSQVANTPLGQLSLSPSNKITYNDYNHKRFEPGTEGRPFAYFVQTGGRFLYASAIRVVVLKVLVSLSAAADTLALSSLEVDLTGLEEGSTITVKWRGKPVFIQHRTDEQIASANSVGLGELKDPQKDVDRVVDPKYLIVIGVCTHLGCVPIAGAGNYGGWFCPCHGSHYDGSGRIREGPAPYNLEIPEYKFLDGRSKVIIG